MGPSFSGLRLFLFRSELSVDEHAELLAKAARVAWRRAVPRVQAAPQADWMDEEAWQAVRARAVARRAHPSGQLVSLPSMTQAVFRAMDADSEQRRQELLWDVEGSICRLRRWSTDPRPVK